MRTQSFGRTTLQVTPLGMGLAALGRPGYINLGHAEDLPGSYELEAMRAQAHHVLDAAWQAGVRYFDVARSYGLAEQFLASWLAARDVAPGELTVGSKWGYAYTANWQPQLPAGLQHEVKDHSLSLLNEQIEESRATLGRFLSLYQIHSATLESHVLDNDEVLSRLAELRDSGIAIGFSTSGPQQAETIRKGLEIEHGGRPLFASVQATWNLLEQSAGAALAEAHDAGFGVIVKEALANGRLTARNEDAEFKSRQALLYRCAADQGVSIDAVALACVLQQSWVNIVLSGAATTAQLASNLQSLELAEYGELDALLEQPEPAATYWAIRGQLAWN